MLNFLDPENPIVTLLCFPYSYFVHNFVPLPFIILSVHDCTINQRRCPSRIGICGILRGKRDEIGNDIKIYQNLLVRGNGLW